MLAANAASSASNWTVASFGRNVFVDDEVLSDPPHWGARVEWAAPMTKGLAAITDDARVVSRPSSTQPCARTCPRSFRDP